MTVLPDDAQIRVLIDHHHDSGWAQARRGLGGGPLQVTICRETLKWGILKRYHVLVADATAPATVTANELKMVKRFVSEGGGLLLAGSLPAFEFISDAPADEMPANRLAEPFGLRFLSPSECAGEPRIDRNFQRGYRGEDVVVGDDLPDGFGPQPPGADTWAPVRAPHGSRTLLGHRETGEPLATMCEHGDGRICAVATPLEHFNLLWHAKPLLRWLAAGAGDRPGRDIPAEVGVPPTVRKVRGLRLICDEPVAERADEVARLVRAFDEFMEDIFGDRWEAPEVVQVLQAVVRADPWWNDPPRISAAGSDWAVAWSVAFALAMHGVQNLDEQVIVALLPEYTALRHLALRFLERLGFEERARRLREIALQQAEEAADGPGGDLARVYWATLKWHPKGMWLLEQLADRYGKDFLGRMLAKMPRSRDQERLPSHFASHADRAAYYMSLAAGEDLFPWLQELGITLHPLPIVAPDDESFDEAMRAALAEGATSGPPSRRLEALTDLAALDDDARAKLPDDVRPLVDVYRRSSASDQRAAADLRRLADDEDEAQAAWAALQLLSSGHEEAADRLAELAPRQDLRFRLMAGHVLRKAGRDVAELSVQGLVEDGAAVGELEVKLTDYLAIHPKVAGYEVANVICESGLAAFPHGNFATRLYVDWVHTSPQWRRSGLSRLAFGAAMAHKEAQRCSSFALSTGTRNTAHALYRDFGFVDMDRRESASKRLCVGTPCPQPDGVVLRPMEADDRPEVRRFLLDYHANAFTISPLPVPELGEGQWAALAERQGKLIGVALGRHVSGDEARLLDVAVNRDADDRTEVGTALLSRLHRLLAGHGARTVKASICSQPGLLIDALCRAGYSRRPSGGVNMFGIRDLRRLFEEIRPLYEHRLADGDQRGWAGRVIIIGERLQAGLEIDEGAVHVVGGEPAAADIVLRTSDEVITRSVTGRETPLEGYLQRRTEVQPQTNSAVVKLLETLFPQVPFIVRWGW